MKAEEFKKKSKKELNKLLLDSRERLRVLRFDLASGRVKDVKELGGLKKDVARILTILKQDKLS